MSEFREAVLRRVLPVAVVGSLILGGCAGEEDSSGAPETTLSAEEQARAEEEEMAQSNNAALRQLADTVEDLGQMPEPILLPNGIRLASSPNYRSYNFIYEWCDREDLLTKGPQGDIDRSESHEWCEDHKLTYEDFPS